MSLERWLWSYDQHIPSDRSASHRLLEEIGTRMRECHWTPREIYGVQLALEEALANAIRHGNRQDTAKRVHVICKVSEGRVLVEVADEGTGFAPEEVPDPTAPENLDKPSGRGLLLMRSYMNRVQYNQQGNAVLMEKVRPDRSAAS